MLIATLTRRTAPLTAPLITLLLSAAAGAATPSVLQQPAASPDGTEVAFVTAGGIWTVPAAGGDATPLVANLGDVLRPLYSPDGRKLAFVSTKSGNGDIYVLSFDTGELKRLTYDDAPDRLDAWSPDGRFLYFSSGGREVGGTSDVYRIGVDGGTAMPIVAEPFGGYYYGAPSPRRSHGGVRGRRDGGQPVVAARPRPHRLLRDLDHRRCRQAHLRAAD